MRRNKLPLALAVLTSAALLGACDAGADEAELPELDTEPAATTAPVTEPAAPMTAEFEAGEAATGDISGTVNWTRHAEDQGLELNVQLQGLSQGEHAWHVHSGPCGEQAPVVIAFTDTNDKEGIGEPLTVEQGATAQQTVHIPQEELRALSGSEFSLHVHQSGGVNHGPTVACADLPQLGQVAQGTTDARTGTAAGAVTPDAQTGTERRR